MLAVMSCDNGTKLSPRDLMSDGLPIKIMAPDSVQVTFDDMGIIKEMNVKGDGNYNVQITAVSTDVANLAKAIDQEKESAEGSAFFSKMIEENEDGFIYEKKIDEEYTNYDFRLVKIRGDQKYVYKTGLGEQYSLDDVKMMYNAVK